VHGGTRSVIGVRQPFRTVYAVGLDGPRVSWVQSEVTVPPPGSCGFGFQQGRPTLAGLDLTAAAPFVPPPDGPIYPPLGTCPPPPP